MKMELAFGAVLRRLRTKSGLSQEELAHRCTLDRTYISLLERGLRQPTLSTIFRIADTLEASPSDLIKQVEEQIRIGS